MAQPALCGFLGRTPPRITKNHVVLKLLQILHWRVVAKGAVTIPIFLASLLATQADRKVRKWIGRLAK